MFSFLSLPNILGILQFDRADAVSKWQLVLNNLISVSDWDARQSWTRDATPRVQIQRGSGRAISVGLRRSSLTKHDPHRLLKESRLLLSNNTRFEHVSGFQNSTHLEGMQKFGEETERETCVIKWRTPVHLICIPVPAVSRDHINYIHRV